MTVDPRVCGETSWTSPRRSSPPGRSPRVRGNRVKSGPVRVLMWSIPACAGKPGPSCSRRRCPRVDPRVCGETNSLGVLHG